MGSVGPMVSARMLGFGLTISCWLMGGLTRFSFSVSQMIMS